MEHLLRDVKDSTVSNLSSEVSHMASGLRALKSRLSEVQEYLSLVLEGRLPVNHDIMYHLQVLCHFAPHVQAVIHTMANGMCNSINSNCNADTVLKKCDVMSMTEKVMVISLVSTRIAVASHAASSVWLGILLLEIFPRYAMTL